MYFLYVSINMLKSQLVTDFPQILGDDFLTIPLHFNPVQFINFNFLHVKFKTIFCVC